MFYKSERLAENKRAKTATRTDVTQRGAAFDGFVVALAEVEEPPVVEAISVLEAVEAAEEAEEFEAVPVVVVVTVVTSVLLL